VILAAADKITAPSISYSGLAPVLILLGAACVGVLVEAFVPRAWRYFAQVGLATASCAGAPVARS